MRRLLVLLLPAFLVMPCATRGRADEVVLRVTFSGKAVAFTASDIAALHHQDLSAFDPHEKKTHTYSGVPIKDLLSLSGTPFGEKLRGPALALVVVARTRDNYQVAYALTEFDEAFSDRTIILVDREDGQPLGSGMGPFRMMLPGDKRAARWVRMVTSLEVVSVGDPPRH